MFRSLGYEIVFLLYAFEGRWYWRYQEDDIAAMRAEWNDVRVLYSRRQIAMPPRTGRHHSLDEWWDDLLGDYLTRLLQYEDFDVVVVHNVWLSKAFDFVPDRITKIIDAHDLFYLRVDLSDSYGVPNEFLSISRDEEMFGLARAQIVLTIKKEEADLLNSAGFPSKVVNLPYANDVELCSPIVGRHYRHEAKVRFGFLGSNHAYNVAGITDLLVELDRVVQSTYAPIELVIAGGVCDGLRRHAALIKPELIGYVESETDFYESIDIAVIPVFVGTGFKVKVADLASLGVPLLCAEHAAQGIALDSHLVFPTARAMADQLGEIAFHRPPLDAMSALARSAAVEQWKQFKVARRHLSSQIVRARRVIVANLSCQTLDAAAVIQLIATVIHARAVIQKSFYVVVVDALLNLDIHALNATAPPGLSFVERSNDTIIEDQFPPGAQIILDAEAVVCSPIVASLPSNVIALCDLRFFEPGGCPMSPLLFPELRNFIVNPRQSDFVESAPNDKDLFCTPLLGHEMRWDPSVRLIFDSWLVNRKRAIQHAFQGRLRICSTSMDANLFGKSMYIACQQAVTVIDCSIPSELDRLIAWGIHVARGFRSGTIEIVDALRSQSWIGAFLDDVQALSKEEISITPFRTFLTSRQAVEPKCGSPKYRAADGSIFWNMSERVTKVTALDELTDAQ